MRLSLRKAPLGLWLLIVLMCGATAVLMARLFQLETARLLTVKGQLRPSCLPHRAIEAETVNGEDLHDRKPEPKRKHG